VIRFARASEVNTVPMRWRGVTPALWKRSLVVDATTAGTAYPLPGHPEPRKNIGRLIEAYAVLVR
jgi:hypothetical protein